MEELERLKAELKKVAEEKEKVLRNCAGVLLELVQHVADEGFKLKLGWVSNSGVEFNFEKDGDNFGSDFRINYNSYRKQIEMSHSIGLSASDKYMQEIRPFLIERDKIIARLWEHEDAIASWFVSIVSVEKVFNDKQLDIRYEINRIENDAKKEVIKKLDVGVNVCFSVEEKSENISFITRLGTKFVYFCGWRGKFEKDYVAGRIVAGDWHIVEEVKDNA